MEMAPFGHDLVAFGGEKERKTEDRGRKGGFGIWGNLGVSGEEVE